MAEIRTSNISQNPFFKELVMVKKDNNKKDVIIRNLSDDKTELSGRLDTVTIQLNCALSTVDIQKNRIEELESLVSDLSSQVEVLTAQSAALARELEEEREAHQKDSEAKEMAEELAAAADQNYSATAEQLKLLVNAIYGKSSEKRTRKNKNKDISKSKDDDKDNNSDSRNYSRKNTRRTSEAANTQKPKLTMEELIEKFGLEVTRVEHLVDGSVRYCVTNDSDNANRIGFVHQCWEFVIEPPKFKVLEHLLEAVAFSAEDETPEQILAEVLTAEDEISSAEEAEEKIGCPLTASEADAELSEETGSTDTEVTEDLEGSSSSESASEPLEKLKPKIVKAEPYRQLLDGSWVSVTLAAMVIMLKAEHMIPCNRIGTIFKELGSYFPCTSSICSWIIKICQIYFRPIFKRLKEELLKAKVIQADETTLQVINESAARRKSKSFLWQYGTGPEEAFQIVLFQYCPGRGGKYCAEFLRGFLGTLVVDGYAGYNKVEQAILSFCWAHGRRYLIKAAIASSHNDIANELAEKGLCFIDRIFDAEDEIQEKKLSTQARRAARQEKVAPIVQELYDWIDTLDIESLSSEKLRKALKYLLKYKDGLTIFLDNPTVPITNNRAEANFVTVARGRHNWEFAYSPDGAEALALMFTITKTARRNGLNIYKYLVYVLEKLQAARTYQNTIPDEAIESVLPWNPEVQKACKLITV